MIRAYELVPRPSRPPPIQPAGAGLTVAVLVWLLGPIVPVVTFVAGLATLLWTAGGGGDVRMGTVVSNAESMGVTGSVRDPVEGAPTSLPSDVAAFFYGVGLLACSPVAVAVSTLVG